MASKDASLRSRIKRLAQGLIILIGSEERPRTGQSILALSAYASVERLIRAAGETSADNRGREYAPLPKIREGAFEWPQWLSRRERKPLVARHFANCILVASVISLTACAHVSTNAAATLQNNTNNDPAEPVNRGVFAGNQVVDRFVLKPIARGYDYIPGGARRSIHNFLGNLGQPSIAVNDMLQGNYHCAWNTTQRFAINTTVGGAGLFDVATGWGRPAHQADFGQTFGVWGIGPGPDVQLPLLGFSNVRDTAGTAITIVTGPGLWVTGPAATAFAAARGVEIVDLRARILPMTDKLEHESPDYYTALRDITAQKRAALVADGKAGLVCDHQQ